MRCSARVFNRARRSSSLRPSSPTSVCLDIFLLPGASDVATHVERLSSNETNKVAQSPGMPVRSGTANWYRHALVAPSTQWWATSTYRSLSPHLHRICIRSVRLDPDHDAVMRIGVGLQPTGLTRGEAPGGGPILSVGISAMFVLQFPPPRIVNS